MRLKTKLVLAATSVTLVVVVVLSGLFLAQLLKQRIVQTEAANEELADVVRSATRDSLESGLGKEPAGAERSEAALLDSVTKVLRADDSLEPLMDSIVRYSLTVQDVSITDAHNVTVMSTDPDALDETASFRASLTSVSDGSVYYEWKQVFGPPSVLDVTAPLARNGKPFLMVHVGVRSTFLKASFAPGLREALIFAVPAAIVLVVGAGFLTSIALGPLERISAKLETLTAGIEDEAAASAERADEMPDTVVRVDKTIDRLERRMRSKEAGYTALQTNMEQMLDTLRDGVLLFAANRRGSQPGELRAVMVSDAVAHFFVKLEAGVRFASTDEMIGRGVEEIFVPESFLGAAVLAAFQGGGNVSGEVVRLEDGRQVQISLDRIADGQGKGGDIGTLLTLRDTESAQQLEQELEVSRRLAAIGRITAGVGHEVKNPINAMVLHLELLRGKLAATVDGGNGAQRHLEILASEMQRLDRVVQTLADFSRPMELHLRTVDLRDIVAAVIELTWEQMRENGVTVRAEAPREPLVVRVDSDLIRQALLNLVLNGMQAMNEGGVVLISLRREQNSAIIEVKDRGTGIQPELLPRIFELYFTTKKTGSGIGLATTYRILQMHGGALDVRSSTNLESGDHGSVFSVRFPVAVMSAAVRDDVQNVVAMKG